MWIGYEKKINEEVTLVQRETDLIRNETAKLLYKTQEKLNRVRGDDGSALATINGVGLFGPGVLLTVIGGSCGILGIFGSCKDKSKAKAENIERKHEYTMALTDYVKEMEDRTNEQFFLVTNEIVEIRRIEQLMAEKQNKNWKIIEEQFQTIELNFHVLRDCTQILYSNQQLNLNLDSVSSLLNLVYADVKSYKAALYAFKNNLLDSVPTLLDQRLTISLMPRESLLVVLSSVYKSQINASDRLSLAIPTNELHSYYDSKLLREVATISEGLLLTLAISLASSQTAFQI